MKPTILDMVRHHRVIVCCGAGGVGKTTVATGLALAGARLGRRVLALTIDPSRRLADTLGVSRNLWAPVRLPADRLEAVGIHPPGSLDAWMLDPQLVADRVVNRLAPSPEAAEKLKANRIYRHVSAMIAGMQEYTAMESLHGFMQENAYDLVILDTPPSRNALDFLEGPGRLEKFFDGRIFHLFVPSREGMVQRAAANIIGRVLSAVFGEETHAELQEFFASFSSIFNLLNANARAMRRFLSQPDQVAFLLVTSPAPEALAEAFFFKGRTEEMSLPFRGFILNRSQAYHTGRQFPDERLLSPVPTPVERSALEKLRQLARLEWGEESRDLGLLEELGDRAGSEALAVALPTLTGGADDIPSLIQIADALVFEREALEELDALELEEDA